MDQDAVHVAVTRRVRRSHVAEFERALTDFASRSLSGSGMRGVHLVYPPPGSGSEEYGILRSFASTADREAFYRTPLYREWLALIEPMVDGEPIYRELNGLEAWFRNPIGPPPSRWKMAVLTWLAVWPVSMLVPAILVPLLGQTIPSVLVAGIVAAGIVVVLTWVAMPILVRVAGPWLQPRTHSRRLP